jgi:hypothetical protein
MYKQIIFFFFLSFAVFSQKLDKTSVFENNKRIGFLNEETTKECDNCYYFDSENIFNKKIIFRLPLLTKTQEEKNFFDLLYWIKISTYNKNTKIIEFSSTISGSFYRLYVSLVNNKLVIIKKMTYSNGTFTYKTDDDNEMFPSTQICLQKPNKVIINDTLNFNNLFKYNKKECFDCPIKYSLEECLKMNNRKEKFKWN